MRLPRVRFTVRRMMIVVAILALLVYGGKVRRHRLNLAALCEVAARGARHTGARFRLENETLRTVEPGNPVRTPEEIESRLRRAAYWTALRRKYDRGANFPWLPVTPDLLEPK